MTRLKARKPEEVVPGRIKGVLSGPPGGGKTWLALSFPAPYYIDPEGGADLGRYQRRLKDSGGEYFGRDEGAADPKEVIGQIEALATEKHNFKTLVIDSASKIYNTIQAVEAERLAEKDAFGASKKPAVAWARRLLTWLDRVDMNCWLVCHENSKWEGSGKDRIEVGKVPDIWEKFIYELHLSLRVVQVSKGNREAIVGKSRLEGFTEFDRFYLQQNGVDVAYKNFTDRYSKDFIEAAVKQVVLASSEQCAEIRKLLDVVKIAEDEQEKWYSKAGVSSLEELTQEQAAKVLAYIKAKIGSAT